METLQRNITTAVFVAVIVLAPLPFGSVQNGAIAIWAVLLALGAALACNGRISRIDVLVVAVFAIVSCFWSMVLLVQVLEQPSTHYFANAIWASTSEVIGTHLPKLVSATRNQPLFAAGMHICCALSLLGGYFVGRNRLTANLLLNAFAVSALVYAVYGIVNHIISPDHVLWVEKTAYRDVITGPFINANTAAIYFGGGAICWLVLCLNSVYGNASRSRRHWSSIDLRNPTRRTLFCLVSFLLVLATVFMTASRLGSSLTLFALGGAILTFYRRSLTSWKSIGKSTVMIALAVVFILLIFGGRVNQRFDLEGTADEYRLATYRSTIAMINDYPWFGTGLGTFRWAFPAYRSDQAGIGGVWDRAHSTTLEIAAEMGLPFAGLVVCLWLIILIALARGILRRKRDDFLPLASFWLGILAVGHSQFDFSLQIPGLAFPVLILVGSGLAQSSSRGYRIPSRSLVNAGPSG